MSESQAIESRNQFAAAIAEKAWKDTAFHAAIMADANAAIAKYSGQPLPPGVTFKVVEDTADTVHFVLPPQPENVSELSDADLENVAGGISPGFAMVAFFIKTAAGLGATLIAG